MIDSLYIASSGMHAQQLQIDVTANNLANVNTAGFKKSRVDFEDLMYRQVAHAKGLAGESNTPVGAGAAISGTGKVFSVGDVKKTERPLDLAILGDGFFEVTLPDGSNAYTRTGSLQIDKDGMLVNADSYILNPSIQVPSDSEQVLINADGKVMVKVTGEDQLLEVGRLELARFINPGGLNPVGDNLYLPTHKSGDVLYSYPGENGAGAVSQGHLETSNVKMVEELTNLILAQRAYEINSKVVQASDELLSIVNNLRR